MIRERWPAGRVPGREEEQSGGAAERRRASFSRLSSGRGAARGRREQEKNGRYRAASVAPAVWHGAPRRVRQSGRAAAGRRVGKDSVVRTTAWQNLMTVE
ncbi:hypothetical protein CBM2589_A90157 [Cupriavidus taiwanensis]|uniref:Uncharacterized protein n=1 Tax=Cupriavidus taiwanensis TaxID=164546 RepID=A0A975XFH0_9BURK|nr:hypothetical protein CBM2589_A90157 [Cupriavidus taiwanensis]